MSVESIIEPVPLGWELVELGQICTAGGGDIQTGPFGSQLHASDYVSEGIPSVMPVNIGDNKIVSEGIARITQEDAKRLGRYLLRPGDIVYSRRGDVERRALVTEKEDGWLCGTGCLRVRFGSSNQVDPRYAFYYFGHLEVRSWIVRHAIGATMPNLNTSILSALPFLAPPLPEQRAIAHILGTLDDKIELNRKMNQTLEEMARAIFKSWFGDFDPVRAKAEGRKSEGMDAETAALFPDSFEDSELGEIPRGWRSLAISELIEILGGGTPKRSEPDYWGGNMPWFSVKDTPAESDVFVLWTEENITQLGVGHSAAKPIPEGTTIVTARGTVGKLALVGRQMAINQSCYGIRGKSGYPNLFTFFNVKNAVSNLRQQTHGSVFDTITQETFKTVQTVAPVIKPTIAFDKRVSALLERIKGNLLESRSLAQLRDLLLPKLLSGEVRVKDAAKYVEAAS